MLIASGPPLFMADAIDSRSERSSPQFIFSISTGVLSSSAIVSQIYVPHVERIRSLRVVDPANVRLGHRYPVPEVEVHAVESLFHGSRRDLPVQLIAPRTISDGRSLVDEWTDPRRLVAPYVQRAVGQKAIAEVHIRIRCRHLG